MKHEGERKKGWTHTESLACPHPTNHHHHHLHLHLQQSSFSFHLITHRNTNRRCLCPDRVSGGLTHTQRRNPKTTKKQSSSPSPLLPFPSSHTLQKEHKLTYTTAQVPTARLLHNVASNKAKLCQLGPACLLLWRCRHHRIRLLLLLLLLFDGDDGKWLESTTVTEMSINTWKSL